MMRWDVVNHFVTPEASYLEIGVDQGETWKRVDCALKVGVDPSSPYATHYTTSSEFFADCQQCFDVVFIDGLHLEEQVDEDVYNARRMLKDGGTILLHDCIPRTMEHATRERIAPEWYGTVWRSAVKLAFHPGVDFRVMDTDCGMGILKEGSQPVPPMHLREALNPETFHQNYKKIYRMVETL